MTTAALGGEVEVPTLDGKRSRVSIPASTQTGTQFRLKSKGMPALRGRSVGDLYIQATIETPRNLTPRQKELLQEFEKGGSDKTNPEIGELSFQSEGNVGRPDGLTLGAPRPSKLHRPPSMCLHPASR